MLLELALALPALGLAMTVHGAVTGRLTRVRAAPAPRVTLDDLEALAHSETDGQRRARLRVAERCPEAFWLRPDWSGGDQLRDGAEPFWMRGPLPIEAAPAGAVGGDAGQHSRMIRSLYPPHSPGGGSLPSGFAEVSGWAPSPGPLVMEPDARGVLRCRSETPAERVLRLWFAEMGHDHKHRGQAIAIRNGRRDGFDFKWTTLDGEGRTLFISSKTYNRLRDAGEKSLLVSNDLPPASPGSVAEGMLRIWLPGRDVRAALVWRSYREGMWDFSWREPSPDGPPRAFAMTLGDAEVERLRREFDAGASAA